MKPKYKVGDVLYDMMPTRDITLGTIVALLDNSYMIRVSDEYSKSGNRPPGKIIKLSFEYVDTDVCIRLATRAEILLYAK